MPAFQFLRYNFKDGLIKTSSEGEIFSAGYLEPFNVESLIGKKITYPKGGGKAFCNNLYIGEVSLNPFTVIEFAEYLSEEYSVHEVTSINLEKRTVLLQNSTVLLIPEGFNCDNLINEKFVFFDETYLLYGDKKWEVMDTPSSKQDTKGDFLSSLSKQVDGDHYSSMKIQPIDYIHANGLTFIEGCVIKYVSRHRKKNGKKDIEKAIHFLEILIEKEYSNTET